MEILRRTSNDVSSVGTQLMDMHGYNRRVEHRVRRFEETRV